jgi:hypothetical protein
MTDPQPKPGDAAQPLPAETAPAASGTPKKKKFPETTEGLPWFSNHEIKKEPNAFTDADWYNLSYAWAGMAVRLVIVFGSIFSVYQFMAARSEKKIERTLGLVERWETRDNQDAVTLINKRLAQVNEENKEFLPKNPSAEELTDYYARVGVVAMTPVPGDSLSTAMPDSFEKVVYFLNRVAFCVQGNLCDDEVADAYFEEYARSFWTYFSGYIDERRKSGSPAYAEPIENYVTSRASDSAAQ